MNLPEAASRRWLFWIGLSAILILLDQWTKNLASSQLQYGRPVELLPVLNLTLQHNSGAAFSFLSNAGGWQRWMIVYQGTLFVAWFRPGRNPHHNVGRIGPLASPASLTSLVTTATAQRSAR